LVAVVRRSGYAPGWPGTQSRTARRARDRPGRPEDVGTSGPVGRTAAGAHASATVTGGKGIACLTRVSAGACVIDHRQFRRFGGTTMRAGRGPPRRMTHLGLPLSAAPQGGIAQRDRERVRLGALHVNRFIYGSVSDLLGGQTMRSGCPPGVGRPRRPTLRLKRSPSPWGQAEPLTPRHPSSAEPPTRGPADDGTRPAGVGLSPRRARNAAFVRMRCSRGTGATHWYECVVPRAGQARIRTNAQFSGRPGVLADASRPAARHGGCYAGPAPGWRGRRREADGGGR